MITPGTASLPTRQDPLNPIRVDPAFGELIDPRRQLRASHAAAAALEDRSSSGEEEAPPRAISSCVKVPRRIRSEHVDSTRNRRRWAMKSISAVKKRIEDRCKYYTVHQLKTSGSGLGRRMVKSDY